MFQNRKGNKQTGKTIVCARSNEVDYIWNNVTLSYKKKFKLNGPYDFNIIVMICPRILGRDEVKFWYR